MDGHYRVHIVEPGFSQDPLAQTADFFVLRADIPGAKYSLLGPDGVFRTAPEGMAITEPTLRLPAAALEAFTEAIDRMRGAPSHARTEAAVLREWLAAERARVDAVLAK